MTRILVTTRWLGLSRTSEGLCSLKTVLALARAGHEIICVTADPAPAEGLEPEARALLNDIHFVEVTEATDSTLRAAGGPLRRKLGAARNIFQGSSETERTAIIRWTAALTAAHDRYKPDVWYVRAAGWDYAPHHAALELTPILGVPWIAHIHDPWPGAALPAPYAHDEGWRGWAAIRRARRVLEGCDASTFPHKRLSVWMSDRANANITQPVEVPHIGYVPEWFGALNPSERHSGVVTHTGLLTRQRDPSLLLGAMADLVSHGADLRFRQIGQIDSKLLARPDFAEACNVLKRAGRLYLSHGRTGYRTAMQEMVDASSTLVLSPGEPMSPFFPAKLADALSVGASTLSLAPDNSVVHDLLSPAGLPTVDPGDRDRIMLLLEQIATGCRFTPPDDLVDYVTPRHAVSRVETAIELAIQHRR